MSRKKVHSHYQEYIQDIMKRYGVDNLQAMQIYRKLYENPDIELDPVVANKYAAIHR